MFKTFVSGVLLVLSIATTPTYASDSFFGAIKDAGRSIGHATRDITREIGHTTRDTTKEIGHAFKKGSSDKNDSDKKQNKNRVRTRKKRPNIWRLFRKALSLPRFLTESPNVWTMV